MLTRKVAKLEAALARSNADNEELRTYIWGSKERITQAETAFVQLRDDFMRRAW